MVEGVENVHRFHALSSFSKLGIDYISQQSLPSPALLGKLSSISPLALLVRASVLASRLAQIEDPAPEEFGQNVAIYQVHPTAEQEAS